MGDFNGDGKLDLAVSNLGDDTQGPKNGGGVSVLLGNGDGTFQPAVSYLNDQKGLWVTVADFNGDGKLDLAMNDYFAVEVLFGNGDGTFGSPVSTDVTYGFPMAVADFNGDGIPDLVAGANVMLGNGDGTFRVETLLAAYEVAAAIGDFNGDGKLDVAISGGVVSIFTGNGDGTFNPPIGFVTPDAIWVAAGDFNGDGKPDLAAPNYRTNNVTILTNTTP